MSKKNSENELLWELWKAKATSTKQMLNQGKRWLKHGRKALWIFKIPSPHSFSSLMTVLKMASQFPSMCLWFWKEQSRLCCNCFFFFFFCFDLSAGSLKDWCKALAFVLSNSEPFQDGKVDKQRYSLKMLKGKRISHCYFPPERTVIKI